MKDTIYQAPNERPIETGDLMTCNNCGAVVEVVADGLRHRKDLTP